MQQSPAPVDGGLLEHEWFGTYSEAPEGIVWNFTIDPAYTGKEDNDPTCLMSFGIKDGCYYIREVAVKRLEFPELMRFAQEFVEKNGGSSASRGRQSSVLIPASIRQMKMSASSLATFTYFIISECNRYFGSSIIPGVSL